MEALLVRVGIAAQWTSYCYLEQDSMLDVALPCGASRMLGVLRQALILRGRKVAQRTQENNDAEKDMCEQE
eukprot:6454917-Amphidinium_carterae.2